MPELIQWMPPSEKGKSDNERVIGIAVAAYNVQNQVAAGTSDETTKKTNHWTVFLITSNTPGRSIRLDPNPTLPGNLNRMQLLTYKKSYAYSNTANKVATFETKGSPTVSDVMKLITDNGMEKYQFTATGNGCRYWIYCLINKIKQKGWVKEDSQYNAAAVAMNTVWKSKDTAASAGQQTAVGSAPGTFYT